LFLGKLMGDPAHPFLWPHLGPWLAAMAVVFDGMLLAYFTALPVYLVLKATGTMPAIRTLVLFSLAGVLASQLVHVTQHFRQPGLREFAVSWLCALFGCICGLVSGGCFALLANRRFPATARILAYSLPAALLVACGSSLVWSAAVSKIH
jgi:membrane associated rhomboid family serine protease